MKTIAWLADDPGYIGGAELTQAEFARSAPDNVEIVPVGPDDIRLIRKCDRVVIHNCASYPRQTIDCLTSKIFTRYWHDMGNNGDPEFLRYQLLNGSNIFCSGLQRSIWPHHVAPQTSAIIPPPVDLASFRPSRQVQRNTKREGAVWIGQMRGPGKGIDRAVEWAEANRTHVDFYGEGPYAPRDGEFVTYCGALDPREVAQTLWRYETFVFLPTAIEPFGRTVAEAWAAGCKLVVNRIVGSVAAIEDGGKSIENATEDFWDVVLG